MAINKNHEFEELNGIRCAIVEKNVTQERVDFLKTLLDLNKYTVVVAASPPAKVAPAPKPVAAHVQDNAEEVTATVPQPAPAEPPPPPPPTFTVGVTDVTFNPTNAIYGRMLKTPDGHIVTLAYWEQEESLVSDIYKP